MLKILTWLSTISRKYHVNLYQSSDWYWWYILLILTLTVLFETISPWNLLIFPTFKITFDFYQSIRWLGHKLWFTNTFLSPVKPIIFIFNSWRSFLTDSTRWKSFLLQNFAITLPFFLEILWHSSILFESLLPSTFSKNLITLSSRELLSTKRGMTTTSRQSLQEYCSFAQLCIL